jgi:hypothetical protein
LIVAEGYDAEPAARQAIISISPLLLSGMTLLASGGA